MRGSELLAQVVPHIGERVAVDRHAAALYLLGDEAAHGVRREPLLNKILNDGSLARAERAGDADYHPGRSRARTSFRFIIGHIHFRNLSKATIPHNRGSRLRTGSCFILAP